MTRAALCIYMSMCVVAAAPCFAVEARLDADSLVYYRPKPPPGRSVGAVLKDPEGVEWLIKCTPSNRHTADILFATSVLNDRESRSRHVRAAQAREVLVPRMLLRSFIDSLGFRLPSGQAMEVFCASWQLAWSTTSYFTTDCRTRASARSGPHWAKIWCACRFAGTCCMLCGLCS